MFLRGTVNPNRFRPAHPAVDRSGFVQRELAWIVLLFLGSDETAIVMEHGHVVSRAGVQLEQAPVESTTGVRLVALHLFCKIVQEVTSPGKGQVLLLKSLCDFVHFLQHPLTLSFTLMVDPASLDATKKKTKI